MDGSFYCKSSEPQAYFAANGRSESAVLEARCFEAASVHVSAVRAWRCAHMRSVYGWTSQLAC